MSRLLSAILITLATFGCGPVPNSETNGLEAQVLELSLAISDDSREAAFQTLLNHKPPEETISAICDVLQRNDVAPAKDGEELKIYTGLATGGIFFAVLKEHPDQNMAPLIAHCALGTAQLIHARGDVRQQPDKSQFMIIIGMAAVLLAERYPNSIINFRGELGGSGGLSSKNMISLVHEWVVDTPELDVRPLQEAFHEALGDTSRPDREFLCGLKFLAKADAKDFVNEACRDVD